MNPEETAGFKLLDEYARTRHNCFLAEMNARKTGYLLCFRPIGVRRDSAKRYSYRYLEIERDDLNVATFTGALPDSVTEMLDRELSSLSKEIAN
jgi:hypothetical protein